MITKKGWNREVMMSLFKKEASYDAGVTISAATACSMKNFTIETDWPDEVINDKEEVTGQEHGTDQEILEKRTKFTYSEPKAKPNTLAGLAALAFGGVTPTQDGALVAYKHKILPVTVGTALPSIHLEEKFGGIQYKYTGIKCNSLEIAGEAGGYVSLGAELLGSGTRATSSETFVAKISESWLKVSNCKVWLESGTDIDISAALVQATEDISSATPVLLNTRHKSFGFKWNNNLEGQPGFGGAGVLQDQDYARRSAELTFSLLFSSSTELDHFLNQDILAIEFDCKGALIAETGAMYYGFHLIIPRFKLKTAPLPKGGVGDNVTCEFDCDIQNDGTNKAAIIEVYNAQAAYLAA